MEEHGILIKDIIKSHIQKENELERRIKELEEELEKLRNDDSHLEYNLYNEILKYIVPSLRFEYEMRDDEYNIYDNGRFDNPFRGTSGGYTISLDHLRLPIHIINELLEKVNKYKKIHDIKE